LLRTGKLASLRFLLQLRRRGYDVSLNTFPQSRVEYRVIARLVGARVRLSHAYEHLGWLGRRLVTTVGVPDYTRHCVYHNLELARELGIEQTAAVDGYELPLAAGDHAWAEAFVADRQLLGRPLLGVHVGSGGTKNLALRRWPVGHYASLIERIRREHPDVGVLLFGGADERVANTFLKQANPDGMVQEVVAGSLRQTAALLARCRCFLSVDTALMHVAAALRVPGQIVIETPTWNPTVQPLGNPYILVPNPAVAGRNLSYYRYNGRGIRGTKAELQSIMESVTVDAVTAAVLRGLDATKSGRPTGRVQN
jgi:ADP-heptose:LPS heptosyltransferase